MPGALQVECHNSKPFAELSRACLSHADDPTAVKTAHSLRPLGYLADTVCGCVKSACCALGAADLREAAGYRYVPSPIDTSRLKLVLNDQLVQPVRRLRAPLLRRLTRGDSLFDCAAAAAAVVAWHSTSPSRIKQQFGAHVHCRSSVLL